MSNLIQCHGIIHPAMLSITFSVNPHYCSVLIIPSCSAMMADPFVNTSPSSSAIASSLLLPTLLLVALGLVFLCRYYSRRYIFSDTTLPPGPKGLPWIGPIGQLPRHEEWKAFRAWNVEYSMYLSFDMSTM